MKHLVLSAGLLLPGLAALAGGFGSNETGQKALGLGGAFTAIGRDASVAYYNPATLAVLDTNSVSVGISFRGSNTAFRNANSQVLSETDAGFLPLGYVYVAYQLSPKLAAGLSINSPYAYNTQWNDDWEGRSIARRSAFYSVYIQPTLSYQISDRFSIGAGLVYGRGQMNFERQIGENNIDFAAKASGGGFGYNIGILGSLNEFVSFGITYRSAVKMKLENGEATFSNKGPFEAAYPGTIDFNSQTDLPSTLSVGMTDRISDKVSMVFEFNLSTWSVYDSIYFVYPGQEQANTNRTRDFEDAMAFRTGLQYKHDSLTTVRGGLFYDETPLKDNFVSADLPDANRVGLSVGVSRIIFPGLEVDVAYCFQNLAERSIKSNTNITNNPTLSGKYKTFVHSAGIGLNYTF